MSPHGIVLSTALLLGVAGKLLFPRFTLRIVAASAVVLPLGLTVYFRELPSALGLILVAPLSLAGAAIGVAAGSFLIRFRHRFHRSN